MRSKRYEGRRRLLRRMTLGVVKALEVQDASVASASLAQLAQLAHLVASHEAERLEARKLAAATLDGVVSPWVESGMGALVDRPSKARHLIQMLLGIFAAHGVLALDFKPAHSVGDLLVQHLDALEAEVDEKAASIRCSPSTSPRSTNAPCLRNSWRRSLKNLLRERAIHCQGV